MQRRTTCALAVAAAFSAALPMAAEAAPTVSWGTFSTLSGSYANSSACQVNGTGISKVSFYLDNAFLNTELASPWQCKIDTTKFSNGNHTLRAVAYDSRGATTTIQRTVTIQNGTVSEPAPAPTTGTAPTIAITAPEVGGALSGNVQGPPHCIVTGTNIARVMFYLNGQWTNTDGNLSNGLGCWIDTTKHADGPYTLKAVAYNAAGQTATAERAIVIKNSTSTPTPTPTEPTPPSSGTAPTIAFQAPAVGGTLSGNVQGPPNCIVTGSNIARVMFYLNGQWTNTDGNLSNGLGCWIDTTKFKDGPYTVKAVAYNSAGQTATVERAIQIKNGTSTPTEPAPSEPSTGSGPAVTWGSFGTLSGSYANSSACQVNGTGITKVDFHLDGTFLNTELTAPWQCKLDTTKFSDGNHTLKAVAYNSAGATTTITRTVTIQNGTSSGSNTPPTVSFKAPAAGATLSGYVNSTTCEASATDNSKVAKVDFFVGQTLVSTKTAAPFQCAIDTTKFANGSHTLMAVATDDQGASATTQRTVSIANTSTSEPTPPTSGGTIAAADLLSWASGNVPFSQQSGYSAQVVGTYTSAGSIAEGGIHSSRLSNGETLRLGKEADPANSSRKALSFQLGNSDPNTSGSKRSELSFSKNIEMNKVYWIAVRAYVRDWGNESSGGLFGTQLHSGDNSRGLSPSFGIYMSGARNYRIETRYSTSSSPTPSNSVTVKHGDRPIPFGRWVDFVFKLKHNTSGQGFLQAWVDGQQVVDYKGNLGFNTPGYKDYAKFGLYNWGSFSTPRKVMLHNPTVVLDPTGSKYDAATLRAHINK